MRGLVRLMLVGLVPVAFGGLSTTSLALIPLPVTRSQPARRPRYPRASSNGGSRSAASTSCIRRLSVPTVESSLSARPATCTR
jgi:hypothetical protein